MDIEKLLAGRLSRKNRRVLEMFEGPHHRCYLESIPQGTWNGEIPLQTWPLLIDWEGCCILVANTSDSITLLVPVVEGAPVDSAIAFDREKDDLYFNNLERLADSTMMMFDLFQAGIDSQDLWHPVNFN